MIFWCLVRQNDGMVSERGISVLRAAWLVGVLVMVNRPAHAALGGDVASIAADAAALAGTESVTRRPDFDIHVVTGSAGTRLTEYVDRSGRVFAVSWIGPVMPDLRMLLGAHHAAFAVARAAQPPHAPNSPLHVATPDLVVENAGHMRAVTGRAYVPAWLPAGMTAADVR